MALPFELTVGLRYTRAGRRGRRKDGFMSFISGISVASIALGVMALIVVLSVMNGFQKEVRDRMLSVLSHAEIHALSGTIGLDGEWVKVVDALKANEPRIVAAAPFVSGQALLSAGSTVQGAMVRGIDPASEPSVSDIPHSVVRGSVTDLVPGKFGVILGMDLARQLRVMPGDKVTLIVSKGNVTPAGFVPRMKQMTVVGLVSSGHYEFDSTLCVMNVEDATALYRTGGATGLRLKLTDMNDAPEVVRHIRTPLGLVRL